MVSKIAESLNVSCTEVAEQSTLITDAMVSNKTVGNFMVFFISITEVDELEAYGMVKLMLGSTAITGSIRLDGIGAGAKRAGAPTHSSEQSS